MRFDATACAALLAVGRGFVTELRRGAVLLTAVLLGMAFLLAAVL